MFKLYSQEHRIFEFVDYAVLMDECRRVKARSVLEFGPGSSTMAFIEAGCDRVVTCEYQDRWLNAAVEKLKSYPQVSVHRFVNKLDVEVHGVSRNDFDLAFVDSPLGAEARSYVALDGQEGCSRLNTLLYAIDRAPVVLFHDAKREGEQLSLQRVAEMGHRVEMIETPKGFARITRKAAEMVPLS